MKFLQQLDEAANIPLDQLKEKMKKDPRVKMVFQRSLNVDELKDPVQFQKTIHYYLFNNSQVRAYVEKRGDVRDVSKHWFKTVSGATKPNQNLQQPTLDWLMSFVKELFKDVGYVQKKDISKRGIDAFHGFFRRGYNTLDAYTAREIASLDMKAQVPMTLYRGLLFDERSLRSYDGLSGGEGLEFLKSVREGTRVVDLKLPNHTIWTKSKEEARARALHGDEAAWRDAKDTEGGKIAKYRGKLAFVISTLATPDDVLVDMSEFAKVYGWPTEASRDHKTVVLNPGTHVCRIISRHSEKGEEDIIPQGENETDLSVIKQSLSMLGRVIKLPFKEDILFDGFDRLYGEPEIMSQIAILIDPAAQERVGKLLNSVVTFYKKNLANLDLSAVADQAKTNGKTYTALLKINDIFDRGITHKKYANPNARGPRERHAGYAKIKNLESGDEMLTAEVYDTMAVQIANVVATQKRSTDWRTGSALSGLAKVADPSVRIPEKLHLEGWKIQKKYFDLAIEGFYKILGKPVPDSHAEQAKELIKVITDAKRVAKAAQVLEDIQDAAMSVGE